jgi:hypothetical protein
MAKQNSLAGLIDKALALREQMNELKAEDEAVRKLISAALAESGAESAEGREAVAKIRRITVAQVDDEPAFLKWALLKANRDTLKVGVVGDAWRARVTAGVKVPGVASFTREDLHIIKQHKLVDA